MTERSQNIFKVLYKIRSKRMIFFSIIYLASDDIYEEKIILFQ